MRMRSAAVLAVVASTAVSGCGGSATGDRPAPGRTGVTVTHHFHLPGPSAAARDPQNPVTSDFDASIAIDPATADPGKCASGPRHGDVNVPLAIKITNTSGDAWPESTPNPWTDDHDSPRMWAFEAHPAGRVEIVDDTVRGKCGAAGDNTLGSPWWDLTSKFTGLAYDATADFSAVVADVPADRMNHQTITTVFYLRGYTRQQAPRWQINLGTGRQTVGSQALAGT